MYRNQESLPQAETEIHIIDYSKLVDAIQLSVSRLLDMPGAFEATSFEQILERKTPEDREHLTWEVGGHFDEALVSFVIASLISRPDQLLVILAEKTEGVEGELPWQHKLYERVQNLKEQGELRTADATVWRYSTQDIEIDTEQAQTLAA